MSVIKEGIDTEFQELFRQISSETTLDKYINFEEETTTSEPAVDQPCVYWRQEWWEKSFAEFLQSKDTNLINDSDDEIADDEEDVRKVVAAESLDSLDVVKCFAEIHGDK